MKVFFLGLWLLSFLLGYFRPMGLKANKDGKDVRLGWTEFLLLLLCFLRSLQSCQQKGCLRLWVMVSLGLQ